MAADRIAELLDRADAERSAGRGVEASRWYHQAAEAARHADDHDSWVRAALGAASVHVFGTEPGKVPAMLYDVLVRTTDDGLRARLAAALARCWVYASEAERAVRFSDEAVHRARLSEDPTVLADALDAALAVHWGPDDLEVRRALTAELDEVAAHVTDADTRLRAHLWSLQIACETLDVPAMHRQMRALERLGEDSPRALFFAATRRVMLDLLRGRTDTSAHLLAIAEVAGREACLADTWLVIGGMGAYAGVQSGALDDVVAVAERVEEFAVAEGVRVMHAELAYLWMMAGEHERARSLIDTFHAGALAALPRDVNWLLTLHLVLEVAVALGDVELVTQAAELLSPYAGRAVVNAGAVMFHGTTDDTLSRAFRLLGRDAEAAELRTRALATYERIGAQWWRRRLEADAPRPTSGATGGATYLAPSAGGLWLVGAEATPVPGLRGFGYLRELVSRPGQQLGALDLVGTRGAVVEESGTGEIVDRKALAAYRARLVDLDAEIAEAEDWADADRLSAARAERDALLDEIGRVTGLGGRARTAGSSQERARVAVRKAITAAISRLETVDPALAHHLRTCVATGLTCTYRPEPGSARTWVLTQQ